MKHADADLACRSCRSLPARVHPVGGIYRCAWCGHQMDKHDVVRIKPGEKP